MKKIILITLLVIFGCGVFGVVTSYFSYNNKEVSLRAQAEAQRGKVEGVHDKMWKIIQQKAQVTDEYKDAFAEIYPNIIAGRYQGEGDGSLMKWVTESNPNFDTSLYADLMQSIELYRTEFAKTQEKMLDIIREHKVLVTTYPGKWFISNVSEIEYTIVSSTKSKIIDQPEDRKRISALTTDKIASVKKIFLRVPDMKCKQYQKALNLVNIFEGMTQVIFYNTEENKYVSYSNGISLSHFVLSELYGILGEENVILK
jgi:hypothetical protein